MQQQAPIPKRPRPNKPMTTNQIRLKTNRSSMFTPIKNRKTANQSIPLTPIEQLLAAKHHVEIQCNIQEKKLHDDFDYIHQNATSLIISGLTTLLFTSGQTKKKPEAQVAALVNDDQPSQNNHLLSLSNFFVFAQKMLPYVWEVVQPLLIQWGINKAKSLLIRLFTKKKSAPSIN